MCFKNCDFENERDTSNCILNTIALCNPVLLQRDMVFNLVHSLNLTDLNLD